MKMFSVEELKRSIRIEDVVGRRLKLQGRRALCPFHDDHEPSFSIDTAQQRFRCFGCDAHGDAIDFVQKYDQLTFAEAVRVLAEEARLETPFEGSELPGASNSPERGSLVLMEPVKFYELQLTNGYRAHIMEKWHLSNVTLSKFHLGYGGSGLRDHLLAAGFPEEECIKAGVLTPDSQGRVRETFEGRIIIPNFKNGAVVHITGRSLTDRQPKYLHLAGPIRHLFNEDALTSEEVFITEGPFDSMALEQSGFRAVATYGIGGLKPEFISKLKRCESVYLCFDGDEAGRKATLDACEKLLTKVRVIELPDDNDPAEYFREHTKDEFLRLKQAALDGISFLLCQVPPEADKKDLPERLRPLIQALSQLDEPKAEAYLADVRARFSMSTIEIAAYRKMINEHRRKLTEESDSPSEHKRKLTRSARFDKLVDLATYDTGLCFLIREDTKLLSVPQYIVNGEVLIPPPPWVIQWFLPRSSEVLRYYEEYQSLDSKSIDEKLFDDLIDYHKRISELPSQEYYNFLAAWVMHTYLLEHFQYSPMIVLFAVAERGKTRTACGISSVAYRGFHTPSLREPYVLRMADYFQGTIFFDLMDAWHTVKTNNSADMILNRFEKGGKVARVNRFDARKFDDIDYYSVFGPTIIATNEAVGDILETRAVVVNMPESDRAFDQDVTPSLGQPLRERLLAFRAYHLDSPVPEMPKPTKGRLGDIMRPLCQTIRMVKPAIESRFREFIAELEHERLADKSSSRDAEILKAIVEAERQREVTRGILSINSIAFRLNLGREDRFKIGNRTVGRRVRALGFEQAKTNDGNSAMVFDEKKLKKLCEKYGMPELVKTPETQETPDTRTNPGHSGVSGETGVSKHSLPLDFPADNDDDTEPEESDNEV